MKENVGDIPCALLAPLLICKKKMKGGGVRTIYSSHTFWYIANFNDLVVLLYSSAYA